MIVLLSVNPTLAAFGQIAAIVILIFFSFFIILTLAFNIAMAWGAVWLRKKAELINVVRPRVVAINETIESASQGEPLSEDLNPALRVAAQLPATVQTVDQRVGRASSRVASSVIEFHARTQQAKTILKAFFLPGLMRPASRKPLAEEGLEFESPGYRILMERRAAEIAVSSEELAETAPAEQPAPPVEQAEEQVQVMTMAGRRKNAATR